MKRYISLIFVSLLGLLCFILIFYFLLKEDNSYITYIKVQVNPSFVIGINKSKHVVFYNSLNSDGNKYNLSMFQGKDLSAATKTFIKKLGNVKEDKDEIQLTIMSKNKDLQQELFNIMKKEIIEFDKNYKIILLEPSYEDMERFSGEVVYNIKSSLNDDNLKEIGYKYYLEIDKYVVNELKRLNLNKLSSEKQISLLKEKEETGLFNKLDIGRLNIDNYTLLDNSNYSVVFTYNEDNTYSYSIIVYLEFEKKVLSDKTLLEVYNYDYSIVDNMGKISNLKKYFYMY